MNIQKNMESPKYSKQFNIQIPNVDIYVRLPKWSFSRLPQADELIALQGHLLHEVWQSFSEHAGNGNQSEIQWRSAV